MATVDSNHRTERAPLSLLLVAALFTLGGVFSVIHTLISLAHYRIRFDVGIIGLFVGIGLAKYSSAWRKCALALIWLTMLLSTFSIVFFVTRQSEFHVKLFGLPVGFASSNAAAMYSALILLVAFLKYRVLRHPPIAKLFDSHNRQMQAPEDL